MLPENYTEFLHWIKEETETTWKNMPLSFDEHNNNWIIGAKWVGLTESEISAVEKKYDVRFTQEHREFLKVLHAIDKKRPQEFYNDEDEIVVKNTPYFYNWLSDETEIKDYMNWPYREILRDIRQGVWFKIWGNAQDSEKEKLFSEWFNKAPKLLPILGHRFVVNLHDRENSSVLSVWGTDTIIYGWNMKHYLINELGQYLNIHNNVFDEEDGILYSEYNEETKEFNNRMWELIENRGIPMWSDLVKSANPK